MGSNYSFEHTQHLTSEEFERVLIQILTNRFMMVLGFPLADLADLVSQHGFPVLGYTIEFPGFLGKV